MKYLKFFFFPFVPVFPSGNPSDVSILLTSIPSIGTGRMKLLKVYQFQHHQMLGSIPILYLYQEKNISLSGFLLCQSTPFHTTNILLPSTRILWKSSDPIFFKVITISIDFSIRKAFYIIFDKID